MHIFLHNAHLTYCSNIHPGETWEQTFTNLKTHTTGVRDNLTRGPFGIGLRLSNEASMVLTDPGRLNDFRQWLDEEQMYVAVINGFPYGGFHKQVVKDQVHYPDWTTPERLAYTLRLFDILMVLLPEGLDGGVSTSPLSYRFWYDTEEALSRAKRVACHQLVEVAIHLDQIRRDTGKILHLDIEPEPDGIIETSQEFIEFYQQYLLTEGRDMISLRLDCTRIEAEEIIRKHIQLCYDVCHFAVGFENALEILDKLEMAGIRIGRIQISAALSSGKVDSEERWVESVKQLQQFDEPVYLHQAVIRSEDGVLSRYPDLRPALESWNGKGPSELRTHFHVPVFTRQYGVLIPTQKEIVEVLNLWQDRNFTNHLEVETYTWDVLPDDLRTDIVQSIVRELEWVLSTLGR